MKLVAASATDGTGGSAGDATQPGVRCVMASVSIAEVAADRSGILQRSFAPDEARAVAERHPWTTAGLLAAKTALCDLCVELLPGSEFSERSFVLDHDEVGAPRLAAILGDLSEARWNEADLLEMLSISISHTRNWAYGYALLDEAACPPRF